MDIGMLARGMKLISVLFHPASSEEWTEDLHMTIRGLGELTSSTEDEFLSLGIKLQQFNGHSRDISEMSSSITTMMSGREMTDATEGLRKILKRIKDLDNDSRKGTEILRAILSRIEEMHRPLVGFERIVRNLRVLCNFIKIESARLEYRDTGFDTLSEDVGKLAGKIESKSADLFDQSMLLSLMVKGNLNKISGFEQSSHGQALCIVDGAIHCLNSLTEKHDLSSATLHDVADRWKQISRDIGEVVASLQFHDITRQRIEHVKESIVEITDKQPEPGSRRRFKGFKENISLISGKDLTGWSGGIMSAVNACELQRAQLDHARTEVIAAIERIIKGLQDIAYHIKEMCKETHKLVNVSDASGSTFISSLEKGFSMLTGSIAEYHRINEQLSETIDHAAQTIGAMSTFISDLEKIGIEIRMIGLNACVRAAHVGEKGASLGILAESIHQLSADTSDHTDIISESLKKVIQSAQALTNTISRETTGDDNGLDLREESIAQMMKPLHQVDEDTLSLLNRINEKGNTLSDDIINTVNKVQVHRQFDREIESVISSLDASIVSMKSILPAGINMEKSEDLKELEGRYTMHSERVVHQAMAGGAVGLASLAMAESVANLPEAMDERIGVVQEDLGDNVELF
jgi:methyl-accepting chemotaxis protein